MSAISPELQVILTQLAGSIAVLAKAQEDTHSGRRRSGKKSKGHSPARAGKGPPNTARAAKGTSTIPSLRDHGGKAVNSQPRPPSPEGSSTSSNRGRDELERVALRSTLKNRVRTSLRNMAKSLPPPRRRGAWQTVVACKFYNCSVTAFDALDALSFPDGQQKIDFTTLIGEALSFLGLHTDSIESGDYFHRILDQIALNALIELRFDDQNRIAVQDQSGQRVGERAWGEIPAHLPVTANSDTETSGAPAVVINDKPSAADRARQAFLRK